jgi:hypothetical protein
MSLMQVVNPFCRLEKGLSDIIFIIEALAKVVCSVIPAKAGIQNAFNILDSGSRFACPE